MQYVQIQPPSTEAPLPMMPIRALEVRTTYFLLRMYVPATATFIGDERETMAGGDILDEYRVVVD